MLNATLMTQEGIWKEFDRVGRLVILFKTKRYISIVLVTS